MNRLTLELEGRILSKKRRYRMGANNSFYLDKKFKDWQYQMGWQIKRHKPIKFRKPIDVIYYFDTKGGVKIDIDNMIVTINDLLQEYNVIEDDTLIRGLIAFKRPGCDDFKTTVIITERKS